MNQEIINQLKNITEEENDFLNGRKEIDRSIYMTKSSSIIDSHKLLEKGKLIEIRPHTRFVHFPKHTHNYVEMVYMCEGQTTHIINGKKVILKKGELLILSQSAQQEIYEASENDIAVNFIILPEFFDRTLLMMDQEENLIRDFIVGCLKNQNQDVSYLHFKVADELPIQNIIENIIWTLLNKQQNKRRINQISLGLLFLHLMNHTMKMTTGEGNEDQQLLLTVYRYIEEQYREGELTELASNLHYDLYTLSRIIKRLTGKTYTELVQIKRLSQAAFLLTTTNMSVADISVAVGYDNVSYFYRLFKSLYNLSPKQYQEKI